MNRLADEIKSYLGSAKLSDEEFLAHYGMPRRSGRYPWGSGKDPYQHSVDFLGRIEMLRKKGWKESPENIQRDFGLTLKQYRMEKTLCLNERRSHLVAKAKSLKQDGLSNTEIARKLGLARDTSVISLLNEESEMRMNQAKETANFLRDRLAKSKHGMLDVGVNVEHELNISREKLDTALYMLQSEGYGVYSNRIPQPTNKNQMTTQKVLCAKNIKPEKGRKTPKEIYDYENIESIVDYISRDGGKNFEKKFHYPVSIDSKRVKILCKDEKGLDGLVGEDKDGLIEIRPNVPDLSLNGARYSQVRILVDKNKYLKGMAVYSDNIPDGYDIVFNSNKKNPEDAYKKIKNDPDNPFGSAIKDADQGGQHWYIDPKTGKKKLSAINKRADEGDWTEWKDALPSQFLSKQSKQLAKKQLELAKANKAAEFDEIMSLTNPTIKKYYLEKFAKECDRAAMDLKAASLPGQKYHVIIPINTMGDEKVYAPQYKNGTKLALIRYPHGGTFEIPVLTVDNKNSLARRILGTDSVDVVGISKKIADRLSGADFDGDTVMCIPTDDPNGKIRISRRDQLEGLKGFDPKIYQYDSPPKVDKNGKEHYYRNGREISIMKNTDNQMGRISNLISDMNLQGASADELARAVRHSMVVIDAEKHKLDYKASELDNNIQELRKKYQSSPDDEKAGGAHTIISRSKSPERVPKRKGEAKINQKGKAWYDPSKPEGAYIYTTADPKDLYYADSSYDKKTNIRTLVTSDGKKIRYDNSDAAARAKYSPVMRVDRGTGEVTFTNRAGDIKYRRRMRTTDSYKMAETDDARTLMSDQDHPHPMEVLYADYANTMKALANKARKELVYTPRLESSPDAKRVYSKEVSRLEAALNEALKNSPKERAVLRLSNVDIQKQLERDPEMNKKDLKKYSQRAVSKYRNELGTITRKARAITISDREWEAIQAGAISENKLKKILNYTDTDSLRSRAMPKGNVPLTPAQIARIKRLADSNHTLQEIAEKMGKSTATISKYLKGEK